MAATTDSIETSSLSNLLQDLRSKVQDLKTQIKPIHEKFKNGEIKTSKGVSFLEVKYHVMLQYITQLGFFIQLKLSGRRIEGHPVIESLVELRVVLEKMKPVEAKLKYQIDKLVRSAVLGTSQNTTTATANEADPLAYKPNPMALLAKDEGEDEEEEKEDDIYRPPKMAPVQYNERLDGKKKKHERDEERLREKASRSRVMKDLMSEMNDAPEEIDALGGVNEGTGYGEKMDSLMKQKDDYEESNYVRLMTTRKEKQQLKAKNRMRFENEFDNLNDFGNLVGLEEVDEAENAKYKNVLNRRRPNSGGGGSKNKRARRR